MKYKALSFKKISFKLTLVYAFVFSVVLIALNAFVLYGVKYFIVNQSFRQVEATSKSITDKIEDVQKKNGNLHDEELLSDIQPKENINIKVVDSKGNTINISPKWNVNSYVEKLPEKTMKVERKDKELVCRNSTINTEGKEPIHLIVVKDMEHEYHFLKLLFVMMAVSDIIGMIIAIVSGMFVSKRVLRPIENVTKAAQSISIKDLSKRIEVNSADDELSRLARTFNEMIERLEQSFESQNKFVSDASHELRTPISVIQGYINLLDRWGKEDKEILQKSIDIIKNETANMTNLIERLLFLARGDNKSVRLEKENFKLNELIDEVIIESKVIAPNHNILNKKNDEVTINADYRMIKQAVRAIIDNSIKYTQEKCEIIINSIKKSDIVEITIEDTGVGIPEDEIPKIFNRFYRVDKARSKKTGGSGLGLAIVKQIIDLHYGSILVESKQGEGTKIYIRLPLQEAF